VHELPYDSELNSPILGIPKIGVIRISKISEGIS
jgi:hypothetical protein